MKRFLILLLLSPGLIYSKTAPRKVFTTTPVYDSIIAAYQHLATMYPTMCRLEERGKTDIGKPLHLFIMDRDAKFSPVNGAPKTVILINNGIHPGEPDGIDASIEFARHLLSNPVEFPSDVILLIIPVYNVDGCLNRGSYSRANQEGPEAYGFRGNAKNLDLNRDFIKADAWNTLSLEGIFNRWKPDIFVDTHVSDGADYQYVITLIPTQKDKLDPWTNAMMQHLLPDIYAGMKDKKYEMSPYVETHGETPDSGIDGFLETPRFSTGYAALFGCIGFVTETHMLKPYNDRVWATYEFLMTVTKCGSDHMEEITNAHRAANNMLAKQKIFALNWQQDSTQYEMITFKGYAAKYKTSEVTGQQRLYYDHQAPYTKQIRYYNKYVVTDSVVAPDYYIIPQAYWEVVGRLDMNGVVMKRLSKDTVIKVQCYSITEVNSPKNPYESHFLHTGTKITTDTQLIHYDKGDFVIAVNQSSNRYIVETLEPVGDNSFFAWNFFDGILQQKEWFSDYVFEEKADSILKSDPSLKAQLKAKQDADPVFAKDGFAQLLFVYQHSGYMEKSYRRYPVTRLNTTAVLPLK